MNTIENIKKILFNWLSTIRYCFDWQFWYISFSFITAIYLFFLNPVLVETFEDKWVFGYLQFSKEIYSPQTSFYAESVLFPWLAFLIGASKSWIFYKILCSFLTILILPTIAYFAAKYFNIAWRSWIFMLLFAVTYRYLWRTYNIGYPDHMTIIFLGAIALQRQPALAFLFAVLAATSHFTIALISIAGLTLLISADSCISKILRCSLIKNTLAGLVVGRAFLELWFFKFDYHLQSRLDWAREYGLKGFMERYEQTQLGFWLTPGIPFLLVYGTILIWIFYRRQFEFALAMIICLALAYVALFLTIDGLRVFAVVISAPYVFVLRKFVNQLFKLKQTEQYVY